MARKPTTRKTKRKTKTKKPKPRVPTKIGVLTSIPFIGTSYQTEFIGGLGAPLCTLVGGTTPLGYDKTAIATEVGILNGSCDFIVTVGGSITEVVADELATKPFVSLDGGPNGPPQPQPPTAGMFRWRVSLESLNQNPHRKNHLNGLGFAAREIGILANINSEMQVQEKGAGWADWQPVTINETDTSATALGKLTAGFGSFRTAANPVTGDVPTRAVIVSADPYFTKFKTELVQAANRWVNAMGTVRRVCYPLLDYLTDTAPPFLPQAGKTTIFGPALVPKAVPGQPLKVGGYWMLGQAMRKLITNPTPHGTDKVIPPYKFDW